VEQEYILKASNAFDYNVPLVSAIGALQRCALAAQPCSVALGFWRGQMHQPALGEMQLQQQLCWTS